MTSTLRQRFPRAEYDPWFQHIKPPDQYSLPSVTAFRVFSMFGFVTCVLFTATILLSRRVHRHKSVPNFFGFLAFSSLMVNITWFTGHVNIWETKNPPPFALCHFQSSVIAGFSTGQGMAAFFLVFQVSRDPKLTARRISQTSVLYFRKGMAGNLPNIFFRQIGILLRLYGELPMSMDSKYKASNPG